MPSPHCPNTPTASGGRADLAVITSASAAASSRRPSRSAAPPRVGAVAGDARHHHLPHQVPQPHRAVAAAGGQHRRAVGQPPRPPPHRAGVPGQRRSARGSGGRVPQPHRAVARRRWPAPARRRPAPTPPTTPCRCARSAPVRAGCRRPGPTAAPCHRRRRWPAPARRRPAPRTPPPPHRAGVPGQRPTARGAGGRVPQPHRAVVAAGGQQPAAVDQRHRTPPPPHRGRCARSAGRSARGAGGRVPQPHRAVVAAGGQHRRVRRPAPHAPHPPCRCARSAPVRAGFRWPGPTAAPCPSPPPVASTGAPSTGANATAPHRAGVPGQRRSARGPAAGSHSRTVPSSPRGGQHRRAVGETPTPRHRAGVPGQRRPAGLAGGRVPQPHRAVVAGGGQQAAVRRERAPPPHLRRCARSAPVRAGCRWPGPTAAPCRRRRRWPAPARPSTAPRPPRHRAGVPGQRRSARGAGGRVPQPHRAVVAAGGQHRRAVDRPHAPHNTEPVCPVSAGPRGVPAAGSHSRTVSSPPPPVASTGAPSTSPHAPHPTVPVCPVSGRPACNQPQTCDVHRIALFCRRRQRRRSSLRSSHPEIVAPLGRCVTGHRYYEGRRTTVQSANTQGIRDVKRRDVSPSNVPTPARKGNVLRERSRSAWVRVFRRPAAPAR